jgi:hypothetical protein
VNQERYAWTRIVSAIAALLVPVAVTLSGWWIQKTLQDQTNSREYVQLAASLLKDKDTSPDLRDWATRLMSQNSPIPFSAKVQEDLRSGRVTLPLHSGGTWIGVRDGKIFTEPAPPNAP